MNVNLGLAVAPARGSMAGEVGPDCAVGHAARAGANTSGAGVR